MMNPDAYDYTFTSAETRLWRKNLRDVNGDGVIDPNDDGVDLNRNWPEKWNYDLEGSSDVPASETYHGTAPASEPEVQAARSLQRRLKPRFLIDYHSFAQLILYPEGWQVETEATDAPLMKALAGDDDHPAVAGFDPDVSAELYTTNGDVTGDAYNNWGTQAFTVELDGGTRRRRRRHGRRPGLAAARRLRVPGRRDGRAGRVREEPRLRTRPRQVRGAARRAQVAPGQHGAGPRARARSRSRPATRRRSRSTRSGRSATSGCSGRSTAVACSAAT